MDGCARVTAEQKPGDDHPVNPSSFLSPRRLHLLHPSERERWRQSGAMVSPLAGMRIHRKVSAPPSSGITVVPRSDERRGCGSL
jgi:hypothetical protein